MAGDRASSGHEPVRRVVRITIMGCAATALALLGADWTGLFAPADGAAAARIALVLGLWACLLSGVLLAVRPRD
jgi:hypothetical protein